MQRCCASNRGDDSKHPRCAANTQIIPWRAGAKCAWADGVVVYQNATARRAAGVLPWEDGRRGGAGGRRPIICPYRTPARGAARRLRGSVRRGGVRVYRNAAASLHRERNARLLSVANNVPRRFWGAAAFRGTETPRSFRYRVPAPRLIASKLGGAPRRQVAPTCTRSGAAASPAVRGGGLARGQPRPRSGAAASPAVRGGGLARGQGRRLLSNCWTAASWARGDPGSVVRLAQRVSLT